MTQSILELIFRSKKQGEAAKQVEKDLKGTEKAADSFAKKIGLTSAAASLAGGMLLDLGKQALMQIPVMLDLAEEYDRAETALIAYAGSAEEAAAITDAVQEAAGRAIPKMDAMQNATKLLSMGLASNADEAARMTDIAVTLGATMGKGPQAAFEEFTLLLANQSILRLDTFGISGATVRQRMEELAEATGETDRQTLFLTATMEEATAKMDQLDQAGFRATSNLDRMKATFADLKVGIATTLADSVMPYIDASYEFTDTQEDLTEAVKAGIITQDEMAGIMVDVWNKTADLDNITDILKSTEIALRDDRRESITRLQELESATDEAALATDGMTEATKASTLALQEWDKAKLAKEAIDILNDGLEQGTIDQQEYNEQMIAIGLTMLELPGSQIMASQALQELEQDYQDGKIGVRDYVEKVKDLNDRLEGLPRHIQVYIDVTERWKPGPLHGGDGNRRRQHGGDVWPNESFLVGETGPELFVPTTAGTIIPGDNISNTNNTYNFYLNASYPMQSEGALRDDVRMLMQLYGRR